MKDFMLNPLKIKIMEFSGRRCITADVPGVGIIKAVDDSGRWIFKGRKTVSAAMRSLIDYQMEKTWNELASMINVLDHCQQCSSIMQEDICIPCNSEGHDLGKPAQKHPATVLPFVET